MNDVQLNQMVQNQVEHIFELCKSYAEVGEEDNVRALYEEYVSGLKRNNMKNIPLLTFLI